MSVSKKAYLTYQTCLGLLRPFVVSFCLCKTETTHSRDILLPNIAVSVLQFFQFYLILPIFIFFYTSIFSEIQYKFCFENLRHFNFQLFLIGLKHLFYCISKIFIISYMINQKSRALSDFSKIIYDNS